MRHTRILIAFLAVTSLALTPTPTPTPEPTATPTETVATTADGGSVFVEDGKVYKIDASGARTETELSKEVFTDVFEAGDLVRQLHPELFEGDQKALLDFMLPPETFKDGVYDYGVVNTLSAIGKGVDAISTYGESVEFVIMQSPEGYPADKIYVMMMAVYGLDQALPITVGIQKDGQDILFMDGSVSYNLFQERNRPISVDSHDSFDALRIALKEQRTHFIVPIGAKNSDESTLSTAYKALEKNEYTHAAEKYYVEKYGLQVSQRELFKEGWKQEKKSAGVWFDIVLDEFKSDKKLRGGFVGFLPTQRQAVIYVPQ